MTGLFLRSLKKFTNFRTYTSLIRGYIKILFKKQKKKSDPCYFSGHIREVKFLRDFLGKSQRISRKIPTGIFGVVPAGINREILDLEPTQYCTTIL